MLHIRRPNSGEPFRVSLNGRWIAGAAWEFSAQRPWICGAGGIVPTGKTATDVSDADRAMTTFDAQA
jgi:hypothetical protein